MRGSRLRSKGKSLVAILCIASFLAMSLGSVSRAIAADTWQTWPRMKAVPDNTVQVPAADPMGAARDWQTLPRMKAVPENTVLIPAADPKGAAKPEDAAEKKTAKKRSYGTLGWIALGIAAVVGIVIGAGSGGGDEGGTVTNPGHH